ncbi:hypothetical protein EJ06DRAFT_533633 [Trichodelitschia bisporula]|uniref:Uncharacterized protein n=1 Tax=Trichodelitschia bisporula TaxID=703511 RepID=A0A6G1HLH6_9PEZI|nr:hypothetical protein EJ06DRAFT_533633 [Trichodelitschia bisporula]
MSTQAGRSNRLANNALVSNTLLAAIQNRDMYTQAARSDRLANNAPVSNPLRAAIQNGNMSAQAGGSNSRANNAPVPTPVTGNPTARPVPVSSGRETVDEENGADDKGSDGAQKRARNAEGGGLKRERPQDDGADGSDGKRSRRSGTKECAKRQ